MAVQIRFTGRHVELSDEDRDWAVDKAASLERYHRTLIAIEIRVEMDGRRTEKVELEASVGGHDRIVASAVHEDFRHAFDTAGANLKRQLLKDKEKHVDRDRRAPAPKRDLPGGDAPA